MFGAHDTPWSVEYEAPTRTPAVSGPVVSFHPTKMVPASLMTIVGSTCQANGDDPSVIFTFGSNGATAVGAGLAGCAPGDRPIASAFDPFETTNTYATSSTTKSDGTSLNPLPRLMGLGSSCIIILPRTKRPRRVK